MKGNNEEVSIMEILEFVNAKLKEGSSIAKVERELKLGKDTLRKRLNRSGYNYDKSEKQFKGNNEDITMEEVSNKADSEVKKKVSKPKGNNKSNNDGIIKSTEAEQRVNDFIESEIEALKELINIKNELVELVKTTSNNNGIKVIEAMNFDRSNRKKATFNLDIDLIEKLKEYEKCSSISKSDIVNIAIKNYLLNEGIIEE